MKKLQIILLGIACLASTGCSSDEPSSPIVIEMSRAEAEVASSQIGFTFDLLKAAAVGQTDNTLLSPLSAHMALGMLVNGADHPTDHEILNVLGFSSEAQIADMNQFSKRLLMTLPTMDSKFKVSMAQSIWADNSFDFLPSYEGDCAEYFDASSFKTSLYFGDGYKEVNRWVSKTTGGEIDNLLTEKDKALFALVNASVFDGKWKEPFDEKDTKNDKFFASPDAPVFVKMMYSRAERFYQEDEELEIVSLPYGNGSFVCTVVLPREGVELDDVISGMTAESWNRWKRSMVKCDVALNLPKFELKSRFYLNDALAALGLTSLFDGSANLSKLSPTSNLVIKDVPQAVKVKVDEYGTKVAVATGITGELTSAYPGASITMIVNRPFLMIMEESSTGVVLFAGAIRTLPRASLS